VNHRIFERTLRPLAFRGAHPFECREILKPSWFLDQDGFGLWRCFAGFAKSRLLLNALVGSSLPIPGRDKMFLRLGICSVRWEPASNRLVRDSVRVLLGTRILTSNRVRLPAELKHINKRRKRN
jgi:hypothetical protein